MTPGSPDPVARVRSPGEIALVVPQVLGFVPSESLVVISLREPRGRMGLVQRWDLPHADWSTPDWWVQETIGRAVADEATGILLVVFTERPDDDGELPLMDVVDQLGRRATEAGLAVGDAVLVRDSRWWSYVCAAPECCPLEGTPLAASADAASVTLIAAERALSGRAVLRSREELEASIAAELPLGEELAREALAAAWVEQVVARAEDPLACRRALLERWQRAIAACADPRVVLQDEDAWALVASVRDGPTRDALLSDALERPRELQAVLERLCRRSVPPFDADLCTLLAWTAYLTGGGALTSIALERALRDNPEQSGANSLLACLGGGVHPEELRSMLVASLAASESSSVGRAGRRAAARLRGRRRRSA